MREAGGAWVGWSGDAGPARSRSRPTACTWSACPCPRPRSGLLRGLLQRHAVAALPRRDRAAAVPPAVVGGVREVNRRFAEAAAAQAAPGATVWVHDYQLQLVPRMLRELRPDVRIGFFNHIPFPGYEIFAQLPWRRQIVEGLLGADLIGFQRRDDAANFLRVCRRAVGLTTRGSTVRVREPIGSRGSRRPRSRSRSTPTGLDELARRDDVQEAVRADPRGAGQPGPGAARRRPARLHQGHPAPAAGLRGAARRGPAGPATRPGPGGQPQPRAGRGLPDAARARSR